MITIGEAVSRVRNVVKSIKNDAFLTDRLVYSLIKKHSRWLIRREDSSNKIMKLNSVFQSLNYIELIDVDNVDTVLTEFRTGSFIKRTKMKIPTVMEGYWGPIIRSVTSLDRGIILTPTFPSTYERISKQATFKFNTKKYYWYLNGYLYFPNLEWEGIRIEAMFEDNVSNYTSETTDDCFPMQQRQLNIPEFLLAETESNVLKELQVMYQIPQDAQSDNKNLLR